MIVDTFMPAASLAKTLPSPLKVSHNLNLLLGGVINNFEAATVNLIEFEDVASIHQEIHAQLVDATLSGWGIKFIDIANCYNPNQIAEYAFEKGISAHLVLKNIKLARPFQIHHSISIIRQLQHEILKTPKKQLIVVTDLSVQFFDPQLANEDPEFPLPQLEQFRYCLGILQKIAIQGNMVLITDRLHRRYRLKEATGHERIHANALDYCAKVHLRIEKTHDGRKISLRAHPYLEPKTINQRFLNRSSTKQMKLDGFFS
ncbi:MAG: hypothetical protein OEZ01_01265 [Candidatus Heimdallarchaeota archaeon]|nr:hypothetical protein [Candidatus Heimdallarchaeota archaeon]MDH5644603.1 hypothetical protein [Candidatus Heimdallarchaeota archaeon]